MLRSGSRKPKGLLRQELRRKGSWNSAEPVFVQMWCHNGCRSATGHREPGCRRCCIRPAPGGFLHRTGCSTVPAHPIQPCRTRGRPGMRVFSFRARQRRTGCRTAPGHRAPRGRIYHRFLSCTSLVVKTGWSINTLMFSGASQYSGTGSGIYETMKFYPYPIFFPGLKGCRARCAGSPCTQRVL